jgi:tetratricopeptide (TPR) repeat protein
MAITGCSVQMDSHGTDLTSSDNPHQIITEQSAETQLTEAFRQGKDLFDKGDYEGAIDYFSSEIRLNPANAIPYEYRGLALYRMGQYKKAVEDFSEATRLQPNDPHIYFNRALAYGADYQKAISDYGKAIELDPNYALAYNNRGNLYERQLAFREALRDRRKAIALNPYLVVNTPGLWMAIFFGVIVAVWKTRTHSSRENRSSSTN